MLAIENVILMTKIRLKLTVDNVEQLFTKSLVF